MPLRWRLALIAAAYVLVDIARRASPDAPRHSTGPKRSMTAAHGSSPPSSPHDCRGVRRPGDRSAWLRHHRAGGLPRSLRPRDGRRDDAHRVSRGRRGESTRATCRSVESSRRPMTGAPRRARRSKPYARATSHSPSHSFTSGHREVTVRHGEGPPRPARWRDLEPASTRSAHLSTTGGCAPRRRLW